MPKHDVAGKFIHRVVEQGVRRSSSWPRDFPVDGALIETWASLENFQA